MKLIYNLGMAILCVLLSISNSLAQEGQVIPFQGTLYQSGTAVNGSVNITFTIADPAWTETHDNVSVTQGVYAVVLGQTNSFPDDMFTTGTAPELVVSIGGTDVATVPLYAPYISEEIIAQNMPGQIERTFDEDGTEFNGLTMVVDGIGNAQTSAFEGVAQSDTQNTGVEGFALSGAGNSAVQYGLYGQATGDGTGTHRGVMGYAAGNGKYNHGIKGYATGAGNGDEGFGFGEGSINFGVEGNAGGNAWSNTGIEGSTFGDEGRVNYGVHGISASGTMLGADTVENYGIAGRAYGIGKNYGVYGSADGGTFNYAGYFDGNVKINGQLTVNDVTFNPDGSASGGDGVFDSLVVQNASQEVRGKLTSYDNGGLELYDRLGEKTFELMSNDTASHFFMYNDRIRSSNGNRYPAFWMKNYDWGTYWQQIGIPAADDPDWEKTGAAYQQVMSDFAGYYLETGNNKRKIILRAFEDHGQFNVNSQDNNKLVQAGGKGWEGRPDLGYLAVYGNPDTLDIAMIQAVEVDGGANEIGQITLNGTDGSTFEFTSRGFNGTVNSTGNFISRNSTNNAAGWFGQFNDNGFMQLVDYNDAGTEGDGAILTGFWAGHPELYMELGNGYHQVDMGIQDSVGYLWLRGKDTQNIEMGSKNWEDQGKNLPFFKMVGNDDGQDLLWMEVQRSAEGEEYGYLSLNGTDGHVATYGAREFELRNDSGNGAGVRMEINHDTNGDDPSGYAAGMSLSGTNGDNIQLGAKTWETNGHDLPFLTMRGSADVDDGGGNFYRPDLVWLEAQRWGDGTELGALTFRGTDGSEFSINAHGFSGSSTNAVYGNNGHDYVNIGAKDWEGNNGDKRGFIHISGTDDGLSQGDTQRGYFEVNDYGNGSFGVLGLKNYQDDGGGHGLTTIYLNGENGDASYEGQVFANSLANPRAEIQSNWGTDGQGAMILRDANDNWRIQASVDDDGSSNYHGYLFVSNSSDQSAVELNGSGRIDFKNASDGGLNALEMGQAGDAGFINLNDASNSSSINMDGTTGNLWTRKAEMISNWGNSGNQGAFLMRDANDDQQVRFSVDDDGSGNYWGHLELNTNLGDDSRMNIGPGGINLGTNPYDNGIVMNYDNSGGGVLEMHSGSALQVSINGTNGDASFARNVTMGNSSATLGSVWWAGNGGSERGVLYLDGTDDAGITDPGRATIEVRNDGAGSYGHLLLRNYVDAGGGSPTHTVELNGETGNIFTPRVQMQSNWGNDGQGSLHLRDANDVDRIRMSVDDDGSSNYSAYLEMTNSQNGNSLTMDGEGNIRASATIAVSEATNPANNVIEMYQSGDAGYLNINNSSNANTITMDGQTGDITAASFTNSSDARFKKNVKSIDNALAKTQQLNGYTYNWNKLAKKQKGIDNKEEQVGVLAQELEAVFPQLVKTDDEGYKSVNYAALTAVLIEAVKELSEQVTNLQGENAELKAELTKVDELEIKIDLIQKLLAKQTLEASQATVSR